MNGNKTNPLLTPFTTAHQCAPFDVLKPEHFEPAFKYKLRQAEKEFKTLINSKEKPTFENTFLPVEEKYDEVSRLGLILFNLNSAETNPEIQVVTQKVSPMLTKFMGKVMLNKKYFKRVSEVYKNIDGSGFTPEQSRLVETTYLAMKRNGAGLNALRKLNLIRLEMKLSKLNLKFNENVLAETNDFALHITNPGDLSGLPETAIETAAQTASKANKEGWIFTLKYPSYAPFLKFAENRELRKQLYVAYNSRGNHGNKRDNNELIHNIVNLRLKQAKMVGYENYAQYVLEERMAESPEKVASFLVELHQVSAKVAKEEMEELMQFAVSQGFTSELQAWDVSFFSEKLKNQTFGFNEEVVKPYFRLEKVMEGVFGLATDLYGITFKEATNIPVYHTDVKTYEVYDENGKFLSLLYTDFFPREGKQGGAWMTEYRAQSNMNGNMIRPHISICCNFSKPTQTKPSLLTFDEVNTFLHEFGHALHGMLANTTYPSLSGTNVYRDFVELPSQIMENWAVEIGWLNKFATHYETGEKMPSELIEKLIASRNFQTGIQTERQLSFGFSDMRWHTLTTKFTSDITKFERESLKKTQLWPHVEGTCLSTSFSHIFAGGYASGYYGYKWAEVLDADAFSMFQSAGIFDRETASRFRKEILEKGGSAHPMELYKNFRGQEPSIEPLLIRSGLK